MSNGISVWAAAAAYQLHENKNEPLHRYGSGNFVFEVCKLDDSLWIIAALNNGAQMAFRTAYSPNDFTDFDVNAKSENELAITLQSVIGDFTVVINFPETDGVVIHYTVTLTPADNLIVPFWPRDVIIADKAGALATEGEIFISQTGTRSGLIYGAIRKPEGGSFLYFQNLTALADYNNDTQTSAAGIVGGQWPELGLGLPTANDKPLQKGKSYIISDAFVNLSDNVPANQFDVAQGFLNSLARLYVLLPRPETKHQDFLDILPKALHDLQNNKGCWSHRSGHPYLNAYVCDYNTPPEIMVQLAVLLPVHEYIEWSGEPCKMEKDIKDGLPAFYDEKLGTIMRWLPSEEHMLDKSEEQKTPLVMDSWYLHHPLLNLARLAQAGDEDAKKLLLPSADYAIKVAHHFKYQWPVFYKMDTLEVIKAETKEGEGGEKDVAGLYAHVMLQIWELTRQKRYFAEAEKAAQTMTRYGFDVFYQANNTMFSAKAMILLYKVTKKALYRDLAYLFLANIFKNVALWECNYGYAKDFPTFFALFPLNDAPYTAVYEEQEAYAGTHEFLNYAEGLEILPSISLLLAEFVKHMVNRAVFYYPPLLPKEMLAEEVKTGELDPNLWVAVEDLHDGWEKSGAVGQEVYGAGLAFGIVPRQYLRIPGSDNFIFIDYPVIAREIKKDHMRFKVLGSANLTCRLCIIQKGEAKLPSIKIKVEHHGDQVNINNAKKGTKEYIIHGDQQVMVSWK